jgi:hypothetical protein
LGSVATNSDNPNYYRDAHASKTSKAFVAIAGAVFERTLQMPIGPSSEKSKSYYPWQQILF